MKKLVQGGGSQRQQYWEDVVRRWQDGGQTVRAFCLAEGVHESAFYFWRRELAKRKKTAPSFLPMHVVAAHASEAVNKSEATRGIEIVLASGRVVRVVPGFDRQTLAEVLSLLEPRPC